MKAKEYAVIILASEGKDEFDKNAYKAAEAMIIELQSKLEGHKKGCMTKAYAESDIKQINQKWNALVDIIDRSECPYKLQRNAIIAITDKWVAHEKGEVL